MVSKNIDKETINSFEKYIELEKREPKDFLKELCGSIPGWVPESYIKECERHYKPLNNGGFKKEKIITLIKEYYRQNEDSKSSDLMLWSLQYENYWSLEHLQKLSQLYYINKLSKEDGLAVLLGNDSKHLIRGHKVLKGAQEGHKHTYGTSEKRQELYAEYQQACEKYRAQYLNMTKKRIHQKVAMDFNCSEKTIQRNTNFK